MKKGLIAPIIITIILVLWLIVYFACWVIFPIPIVINIISAIVFIFLIDVSIYVLVERIQEIKTYGR